MLLTDISRNLTGGYRITDVVERSEFTPEEKLLLAVVLQAILDTLRESQEGVTARTFLNDPNIQSLTQDLWGVRTSGLFDRDDAEHAISAYRASHGIKLQHRRMRKKRKG